MIYVTKDTDISGRVRFDRFDPNDKTLHNRVKDLFNRKVLKLVKYQRSGKTTLLLVENDDPALMSDYKLLDAGTAGLP